MAQPLSITTSLRNTDSPFALYRIAHLAHLALTQHGAAYTLLRTAAQFYRRGLFAVNHSQGVRMLKSIRFIGTVLAISMLAACASKPATFVRNQPGNWIAVEITGDISRDRLWGKVADALKERDLEFEKIDKDAGYMRTSWKYTITKDSWGRESEYYATRVTIDFPSNGKIIRVKTEAQYKEVNLLNDGFRWVEGFDSSYNQTFKDEITAVVGRK